MVRLTREFSFEMAHALEGYDGACSQIHGHSYRLLVTVRGEPSGEESDPKCGMLIDFGVLKKVVGRVVVERYDHTLMLRRSQANAELAATLRRRFDRIVEVDWQPTCENLVTHFASLIKECLPAGVELFCVRLHETANSYAEWVVADNK